MKQYEISEVSCLNGLGHSFVGRYWALLQVTFFIEQKQQTTIYDQNKSPEVINPASGFIYIRISNNMILK